MHPLIEFQYWTVTEFVRQLIEGNVISTIGDKNVDDLDKNVDDLDKKVLQWIERSYEKDFDVHDDGKLQDLTKEIFEQIVFLRLTGLLSGILSIHKFGKS
jgi:hypothetical protein